MKLTIEEKYIFTSEMETILSSGLPVYSCLELITDQTTYPNLHNACKNIRLNIDEYGFTKALEMDGSFDSYMEKMIEIGEMNGRLDEVMKELSFYYQNEMNIEEKIKDTITYPFILLCMIETIIGIMILFVYDLFEKVIGSIEMVNQTKQILTFSKVFSYISFLFIFIIILIFIYLMMLKKNEEKLNNTLSHFILTKKLMYKIEISRFTYAVSLFLSTGYRLDDALSFVLPLIYHDELKDKIKKCNDYMLEGNSFVEGIEKTSIYEGIELNIIKIGTTSGNEIEAFERIGTLYEHDIEVQTNSFINKMEPVLIGILSLIVGLLLISTIYPLVQLLFMI